jgi:hypothetical protein
MDAGDMDADGDIDLVLGSFVYFLPQGDTTGLGKKWLHHRAFGYCFGKHHSVKSTA